MLHHREADQEHDQDQPAAESRLDDVVVQHAGHRHPRAGQPGEDHQPARHQHDGAVIAVEAEIGDQADADQRGGGERDPRDAGSDRGIEDRDAGDHREAEDPRQRTVAEMVVPTVQVEIGEQEDDEGGGQRYFRPGAPDLLVARPDLDHLVQEAEVDADIGQHRPGERRGRGKHRRALDHEQDGQKQRQEAGNADDDAAEQRVGIDRVLVGVRLPEIDLRQRGRCQFGDEGDDRSGVDRHQEHVGVGAGFAVEGEAFGRRDRHDAVGAEIRPYQPRAGQAKMRRHDQPVELLFGVVGDREHAPVTGGPVA